MTAYETYRAIRKNMELTIAGKGDVIDLAIITLFCGGHILIEDVPGTGKTVLARSLAASIDGEYKRIQFTPDLLPSDITGINFFNMKSSEFEFVPGPVFTNILLADEINRATPKTQSGLLECMEERQATIDGKTMRLSDPFMVIATQNPVETLGTFPLPEAQLDRFLMKGRMEYPSHAENVGILARFDKASPLDELAPVVSEEELCEAIKALPEIYICPELMEYISYIVEATRTYPHVVLGVSPRGALALMKAAKGYAAIAGRSYVLPDDIQRAAHPVLEHRIMLESAARIRKNAVGEIVENIIKSTRVPTEAVFENL